MYHFIQPRVSASLPIPQEASFSLAATSISGTAARSKVTAGQCGQGELLHNALVYVVFSAFTQLYNSTILLTMQRKSSGDGQVGVC